MMDRLTLAAALVVSATWAMTTAVMAQPYYGGAYGGLYNYAPGPRVGPYYYYNNFGPAVPDCDRGGPGPRVGCGSGLGIGSQR
jgi:hypothetical protein